jgi:putative membrane protein
LKHRILAAALALGVLSSAPAAFAFQGISMISPPDPQETRKAPERDDNFLKMAAQSDMAEIAMATLAMDRAQSPAVKEYAEQMLWDHKNAAVKNMMLAQKRRVVLPMGPNEEQQATLAKLEGLQGAAFDKAYLEANVMAHEKAVQLFRDEAAYGLDADFRHFAATLLPKLHMHWEHAKMMLKPAAGTRR